MSCANVLAVTISYLIQMMKSDQFRHRATS